MPGELRDALLQSTEYHDNAVLSCSKPALVVEKKIYFCFVEEAEICFVEICYERVLCFVKEAAAKMSLFRIVSNFLLIYPMCKA